MCRGPVCGSEESGSQLRGVRSTVRQGPVAVQRSSSVESGWWFGGVRLQFRGVRCAGVRLAARRSPVCNSLGGPLVYIRIGGKGSVPSRGGKTDVFTENPPFRGFRY